MLFGGGFRFLEIQMDETMWHTGLGVILFCYSEPLQKRRMSFPKRLSCYFQNFLRCLCVLSTPKDLFAEVPSSPVAVATRLTYYALIATARPDGVICETAFLVWLRLLLQEHPLSMDKAPYRAREEVGSGEGRGVCVRGSCGVLSAACYYPLHELTLVITS